MSFSFSLGAQKLRLRMHGPPLCKISFAEEENATARQLDQTCRLTWARAYLPRSEIRARDALTCRMEHRTLSASAGLIIAAAALAFCYPWSNFLSPHKDAPGIIERENDGINYDPIQFSDPASVLQRLAGTLKFETISDTAAHNHAKYPKEFKGLHKHLRQSFPLIYRKLEVREVITGGFNLSSFSYSPVNVDSWSQWQTHASRLLWTFIMLVLLAWIRLLKVYVLSAKHWHLILPMLFPQTSTDCHSFTEAFWVSSPWMQVNELSLLFKWQGYDPSLKPILCISHMDVVAVGSESKWTHPPFSGAISEGFVWGRGALDLKFSVAALLEAASYMLAQGYTFLQASWSCITYVPW